MQVEIVTQADDQLWLAFQNLIPQLTTNNPPPSLDHLTALVRDSASTLMVARNEEDKIIGALTLAVYRVPTGIRAVIEDVVVDSSVREKGVGEALMKKAISVARKKRAGSISLTSNPGREAANKLYQRMGFIKRETNAYQLKL